MCTHVFGDVSRTAADDALLVEDGISDSCHVLESIEFLEAEFGIEVGEAQTVTANLDSMAGLTRYVLGNRSVVWRGVSTSHVREGLDGHIDLETLRELWRPISPWSYLERTRGKKTLLVYAKYDLTFPVDLSLQLIHEFRRRGVPTEVAALPCGHYSTGEAPFKFLDAYYLARFLRRNL